MDKYNIRTTGHLPIIPTSPPVLSHHTPPSCLPARPIRNQEKRKYIYKPDNKDNPQQQ
jgi:hypothetical protein